MFDTISGISTNILGTPSNFIHKWVSIRVSKEFIKPPRSNTNILFPLLDRGKNRVKFNGGCIIQDLITYTPQTIVKIYIVYDITKKNPAISYPTLKNCLFGSVKLTKNPDIDKHKYSGYGIGFDRRG